MMRLILFCLFALSPNSQAHNNHFYPGDAFFSSYWEILSDKPNVDQFSLEYQPLTKLIMNCGNGGVRYLAIKNIPAEYSKSFKRVNQLIEKHDGKFVFPGHARLLIYNKEYDFKKWGIAYRYNEDWVKQQVEIDKLGHAKYDQLGKPERIIQDWRGAKKVKGLDVQVILPVYDADADPLADPNESKEDKAELLARFQIMNRRLKGEAKNYAFVIVLSNTIDRMMENNEAEHSYKWNFYKLPESENLKKLKKATSKPIDSFKFLVITEKILLYEEQTDSKWKVTEIKN